MGEHFRFSKIADTGTRVPRNTQAPLTLPGTAVITATGDDVRVFLIAEEWEHLSKAQCGADKMVPATAGQTITFTVPVECQSIATVKLTRVTRTGAEETIEFGKESSSLKRMGAVSQPSGSSVATVRYQFVKQGWVRKGAACSTKGPLWNVEKSCSTLIPFAEARRRAKNRRKREADYHQYLRQ